MAGRLEDEEYWHGSETEAFNFEDDDVSRLYNLQCGYWLELRIRLIMDVWHYSLEVSYVGCQKAELQRCRKQLEKKWAAMTMAPVPVQNHSLVSLWNFQQALITKLE